LFNLWLSCRNRALLRNQRPYPEAIVSRNDAAVNCRMDSYVNRSPLYRYIIPARMTILIRTTLSIMMPLKMVRSFLSLLIAVKILLLLISIPPNHHLYTCETQLLKKSLGIAWFCTYFQQERNL